MRFGLIETRPKSSLARTIILIPRQIEWVALKRFVLKPHLRVFCVQNCTLPKAF